MFLKQIEIRNFRGIRELTLPLGRFNLLIGENNSGKSSILDALRLCLSTSHSNGRSQFEDYDYHLENVSADPTKAPPICITLTFSEIKKDQWSDLLLNRLEGAVQQEVASELNVVVLRLQSQYDSTNQEFTTEFEFLGTENELMNVYNPLQLVNHLRQAVNLFHLESIRDALREYRTNSLFWKAFVKSSQMDEEERIAIEKNLKRLNQEIIDKHAPFEIVKKHIEETTSQLPLGTADPITIEAVPTRVFEILSKSQVLLEAKTGAHIPIIHHGSGTQSLSVIGLFDAFLKNQLLEDIDQDSEPLITFEEPEAHLHPSAVHAVTQKLKEMSGQKIIATHSGEMLASISLKDIIRLHRDNKNIVANRINVDDFDEKDLEKINHHIRKKRGDLLFSRCWILVEGESDLRILSDCSQALSYNLHADGISIIEFANIGAGVIAKLANQFDIEWILLTDRDNQGDKYIKNVNDYIEKQNKHDRVFQLEYGPIEVFLCMKNYGEIYEEHISLEKREEAAMQETHGDLKYWQVLIDGGKGFSKTKLATLVGQKIIETKNVPSQLQEVIETARKLAGVQLDD